MIIWWKHSRAARSDRRLCFVISSPKSPPVALEHAKSQSHEAGTG